MFPFYDQTTAVPMHRQIRAIVLLLIASSQGLGQPPNRDVPQLPDVIIRPPEKNDKAGRERSPSDESSAIRPDDGSMAEQQAGEQSLAPIVQEALPLIPPTQIEQPEIESAPRAEQQPNRQQASRNAIAAGRHNLQAVGVGKGSSLSGTGGILRGSTSLFDSPSALSVRSKSEIAERGSGDMFRAMESELGVLMQRTAAGQASPFVRGLTGQQVLLMVDGIRMNNGVYRFGPNQYFNTIDPGTIDQIEVLRGEGSVLWGSDAIGGAINVQTHSPAINGSMSQTTEITDYFNTADVSNYTRISGESVSGSTGVYAGGSFSNVRDLDTGFDEFSRQPGTNFQSYSADIKLKEMLSRDSALTIAYQHYEMGGLPRSDRFPGYPGDVNNSNTFGGARFFDPQQRDLAYIRYEAVQSPLGFDGLSFTGSYHRQRDVQTRGVPNTRFQETDVETVGFNLVAVNDYEDFGRFTVGSDWYHDDVDSPFGGAAAAPIVPDDAYYERIGAFLSWDVDLAPRLSMNAAVRYELIDVGATPIIGGNSIHISPSFDDWVSQVGLLYRLTPTLNLVGSVSEGFRAPNLDELTANNPNVLQQGVDLPSLDLTPERSLSYQVGAKLSSGLLQSEVYVYWLDLRDAIVPITAGANGFRRANQDAYIQGCEWQARYLLTQCVSVFGNFWYTYGINKITDAPLSRIPPTQGNIGSRWRSRSGRSFVQIDSWLASDQRRLDPVRDVSDERIPAGGTPGYGLLNLRFGYSFGEGNRNRLSLNIENITDEAYLVHGSGVFGSGATARFGVQSAF